MRVFLCCGLTIALCIGSSGLAFAQKGLGAIGALVGGGGGGSSDVNALADKQSALVKRLHAALTEIAGAQIHFATALGKKDEAEQLQLIINSLAQGNTTEEKLCEIAVQTKNVSVEQEKRFKELKNLDALQKEEIQKGLVPYAKGTAHTVLLGKEFVEHLKSTQGAISKAPLANLAQIKNKLGLTIQLAPQIPGLGSTHLGTATTLIKMARDNNLSTKEADSALETI